MGNGGYRPSITPPCAALVLHPPDSALPLQLFRVHCEAGVEQAGALNRAAANHQRRANQPIDLLCGAGGPVIAAVAPCPRIIRPALLQGRAFPKVDRSAGKAAARRLHATVGVAQLRPDYCDIGVYLQVAHQRRDCVAYDFGIRVQQEHVIKF